MKKTVLFLVLLITQTALFANTISSCKSNNPPQTFTVDNITYSAISSTEASVVGNSITTPPCSAPSAPTASSQSFNNAATVAELMATGTAIQWYSASTGGNALSSSTALVSGIYYATQTVNSCESARTSVAVTVNPISLPGTPTNLVATGINTGGMIQFTAPTSDGGSPITNYEYSTDNGATWITPSPAITTSPLIISSGLTNCTSYQVQIRAVNIVGSGTASAAVQLIPATSLDIGVNWTQRTSAANNNWNSVTYGNGLFVAVAASGTGNRVMTSPDGINWTSRTSAADNQWRSIIYGNGLFVAVAQTGTNNRVMSSPDGITWTTRTSAADNEWRSVTYGNGLFVAVTSTGVGNRVMTSPDGITWTSRTSAADNDWNSVTYGNGLFVAVANSPGTGNQVMTSPDGITWTSGTSAVNINWRSVTYGNGKFVAVASDINNNKVMTSSDGQTWTASTSAANISWFEVTYGNGLFVAVAASGTGNRVMTSPDGINWTSRTSAADNLWRSIIYGNGLFVAVAITGTGNRVMTSGYDVVADAPVITSATSGNSTTVNFTQSSSTFSPAITNYEYSTNNGSSWVGVSPAATTSPLTITGLSGGAGSIMLRALNSVGSSCPSNTIYLPPTASAQTFCGSKTVADLVATGTDLKWYDVATNGTALATTTAITTGTYYVTQTLNNSESERTSVAVTVNTTTPPTASVQTFVGNKSVADLVATGTTIQWYSASTGGNALSSSTALVSGTYYATQTVNSCESSRTAVTITVIIPTILSNFNSFTVSASTSDFTINPPTSNSSGAITYTSSNLAVATIVGTTVHLVGPGTTTITASQAVDGSYLGNSISATMNVSALCGDWGYPLTYITIGMSYQGGIIFYILQPTDAGYVGGETHGLIAATSDELLEFTWADAIAVCNDKTTNNLNDWYLPNMDELNLMYTNIGKGASGSNYNIGIFRDSIYWSSTVNVFWSFIKDFTNGNNNDYGDHGDREYVRAVRSF